MVTIYATAAGDPGLNPALGKHSHVTTWSTSQSPAAAAAAATGRTPSDSLNISPRTQGAHYPAGTRGDIQAHTTRVPCPLGDIHLPADSSSCDSGRRMLPDANLRYQDAPDWRKWTKG